MGILIDGQWVIDPPPPTDEQGRFVRQDSSFRNWVTEDGSSDFKAEDNRYHLYISYACPWACRALIFRTLKGLEDAISVSFVEPLMGEMGWALEPKENNTYDDVNHVRYLQEIYLKADSHFTGRVTVPVLWDKKMNTIVNNESADIIRILNSEFNAFAKNTYDLYPESLQNEIDKINDFVYNNINNGVYRCGFATTQDAYEEAFDALFLALDKLEARLSAHRYLVGNDVTEADWRLFTTLIRFDVVYVGHFKCNLRRIDDYPHLSNYLRELYQVEGVKKTVNFKHIKEHYYRSHTNINPTGIVPKGPDIDYDRPHNRTPFT